MRKNVLRSGRHLSGILGPWVRARQLTIVAAVAVTLIACGNRVKEETLGASQQKVSASALTGDAARIFGFENASDWTSSAGTPVLNTRHAQGASSLQSASQGRPTVTSAAVAGRLSPQ